MRCMEVFGSLISGPNSPTSINARGCCLVGVLWVSKQTDLHTCSRPTAAPYIPPSSLCCVLYTPACHLGRWPVDIMHHSPKTSIHGMEEGRLDPGEVRDAPGLPPTPHCHPAPWQLMQRGFCIALRLKTITSHCSLVGEKPPFCLSVPVFLSLIQKHRCSKTGGQMSAPRCTRQDCYPMVGRWSGW